jgi:hypothetical protein
VKRLLPLLLVLGGCVPDVPHNQAPAPTVVAAFDLSAQPPLVPTPNDLAINQATKKLNVPPSASDTPAQAEFDSTYLDTLSGFPFESSAQASVSAPLDPSTMTARNVLIVDLSVSQPTIVAGVTRALEADRKTIDLLPPAGGWTRGHHYAAALIGGADGLKGAGGEPVVGSASWELVTSATPLVSCPNSDLTSPPSTCTLLVDIIPSTVTDPAKRLEAQTANAIQLEQIRLAYVPLLLAIQTLRNLPDNASVALAWTFSIVDAGEVTFDPANRIVPFPNDLLRSGGKVTVPDPATGNAPDCTSPSLTAQLACGLNTLDGFSTTTPLISENGDTADAVVQAKFDTTNPLPAKGFGLLPVAFTSPAQTQAPLSFTACVNCTSSAGAAGVPTSPQQLQWRLDAPLNEKTTYVAYVTGDALDDEGKGVIANPVFALVRLKSPLVVNGKSQVSLISDAQAAALEPVRLVLKPGLDALEALSIPRSSVALAWTFTTQSEGSLLDQLYTYGSAQTTPGIYVFADQTSQYTAAATGLVPVDAISKFYIGLFPTTVALTGPGGVFDLTKTPRTEAVTFALAVPDPSKVPPPSAAGYPITIFGHGLTRDRNDFLAIANSLARVGQATIATDVIFHGERSSCTGFGAYASQAMGMSVSDDSACADPTTQVCNEDPLFGRCVARDDSTRVACPGLNVPGPDMTGNLVCLAQHRGLCEADGKCEGGDFLRDASGHPVISGWNILNLTNFFATRDNLRQQVIDLATLVHTLRVTPLEGKIGGTTLKFDLTKINYVGQSLGGILGTLFNAVSPDTTNVALNVAGGDLVSIILNAPSFVAQKAAIVGTLGAMNVFPGTPQFDSFTGTVQWILDPADPANLGWRLTHPVPIAGGLTAPNANRNALLQFIEGDETVPNLSNLALVRAADRPYTDTPPMFGCVAPLSCYEFTGTDGALFTDDEVPTSGRHGFLLKPPSATGSIPSTQAILLTTAAQQQVATFLSTGKLPM